MTIERKPWVGKLIDEYSRTMHELQNYHDKVNKENIVEREAVNRLISNLSYSLTWMRNGKEPGNRKDWGSRSLYQMTQFEPDMDLYPCLDLDPERESVSDEDKQRIVDALMTLSVRERQVFILTEGYGLSQRQVAAELNLSRRRVRDCLASGRNKFKNTPTSRPFAN
ncbi:sigma-70 family RNA polymerase sigma factor [Sporolactobacillus shoreicorticis]|uniref:Sigma-70 family RNA polymerase sigma factor n=1 Tax=Sporolactobacillus shoreicorticis TaxID=1923877 RepID=A0ABW5RY90_9BACL|nr:sigma-70 family RNA polymerase sigma factor [Sporolactobacillus shoreicorticis]MCO7125099.1 sigma-70 family RNA polymerase sigma factor [Sporolactobacillus shoreicorticis]